MFALEAIVPRASTSIVHGLELELLFINFRYNCACSVFGQWNVDLKQIIPKSLSRFPVPQDKGNVGSGDEIGFAWKAKDKNAP